MVTAQRPATEIEDADIPVLMAEIGRNAKAAARSLANASTEAKNAALRSAARRIRENAESIENANVSDLAVGGQKGLTDAMLDRLRLTGDRIEAMAGGLEDIAALPDPVGAVLAVFERPNGLRIERVRVPLGVIGVIYESRPNVTADAGALALKAGNACILRGGSESFHSSRAIFTCLRDGVAEAGLPRACVSMAPTRDRAVVGEMLAMSDVIDVIVPRGGRGLIERVTAESRIPLFKHLEGVCHTYIHEAADLKKARAVAVNAKMRRTGICGATETILVDAAIAGRIVSDLVDDLGKAGCEVRGDSRVLDMMGDAVAPAVDADWSAEYLDAIVSMRVVAGLGDAVAHVAEYSSQHTDAIITEDAEAADIFLNAVDSAIVMWNASTQFADGGEFGMGAEIGIATGKMHARGPVGVEQLTSFKYKVLGNGQTRP